MTSSISQSFLGRVRDALADLHPTERRLAEFVLDFPGEIAAYSATELAKLANVSNATVSRFIRRLGYRSYDDARRSVRMERRTGSPLFLAAGPNVGGQPPNAHIEQAQENLRRTFARVSDAEIERIAKAMLKARKVWIIGFRTSRSFATYLRWQTIQVIENVLVVPSAGETLGEHLASMTANDLAIVFGLRRRPAHMELLLGRMIEAGVKLLYVTDAHAAPQPKTAVGSEKGLKPKLTWHIRCESVAPGPLDNHVAVMALCHLISNKVIELSGAAGRRRLTAIEAGHEALHEL